MSYGEQEIIKCETCSEWNEERNNFCFNCGKEVYNLDKFYSCKEHNTAGNVPCPECHKQNNTKKPKNLIMLLKTKKDQARVDENGDFSGWTDSENR